MLIHGLVNLAKRKADLGKLALKIIKSKFNKLIIKNFVIYLAFFKYISLKSFALSRLRWQLSIIRSISNTMIINISQT